MKTEKNPYIGARTFEPEESELFFGREREAQDLLSLVVSDRLVLFYAQSGAGKSSLINTKLIPGLIEEEGFKAFPVGRLRRDEVAGTKTRNVYISNLVTSLTKRNVDEAVLSKLSLSQYLAGLDYDEKDGYFYNENGSHDFFARAQQTAWKYVLVIDQFEELFTTYEEEWEKREDFFRQLTKAIDDFSCLWVVLVMREDYIAYMDPHRYLLPGKLRTRYYMQRLEKDRAIEAVEGPARVFNRSYAPGAAKKLVDELSNIMVRKPDNTWEPQPGQYVEPVQLQVVCSSLWGKLPEDVTTITAEDIDKYVGDLNQALGNFYDDRVKAVAEGKRAKDKGVKERDIRRWFEKELIIEGKRRNMVAEEPGGKSGGLDDEVVREFLGSLVREEKRSGGATFYELTHDRMVEPIVEDNQRWKENWSPLQKQAALWDDQGRSENWLLIDQALIDVEDWAQQHPDEMTEVENDFLAACRKHQAQLEEQRLQQRRELELSQKIARTAEISKRFAIIASILAVASIIAGLFAYRSQMDAKAAEKVAREAQALAQQRADVARARELASQADEKLNEQLDLSMLLSVEAFQITEKNPDAKSMEAQSILFDNAQRSTNLRGILTNPANPANQFRFSPNGKFVALTQQNEESENFILWDLDQDPPKKEILETDKIKMFFFSPDNRYLVYLTRAGVNRWNLETSTREKALNEHVGRVSQVVFHPDGRYFLTLGESGEVTTWDAVTGAMDKEDRNTRGDLTAFSPDNRLFAISQSDGTILVGDILSSSQDYRTITTNPYSVVSMAFSQDGTQLAIADKDGGLTFWDVASNQELDDRAFTVPMTAEIQKIMYRPNGNLLVFNAVDGVAILDDAGTVVSPIKPQPGSGITFTGVLLSSDGTKLAITDSNSQTTLYEAEKGGLTGEPLNGSLAEFSENGETLAIFDRGTRKITLVDVASGTAKGDPFPELQSPALSLKFSGDSSLLAAGTADGSILVWDVGSRSLKSSLPGKDSSPVSSLAFSPDNSQLVAGHTDSTLTQWLLGQPIPRKQKLNYTGRISSIGTSPDGNYFYSIAGNNIVLLNMKDFEHIVTVTTDLPIDRIEVAGDDQAAAIFEKGGSITLWNPSLDGTVPIDGNFMRFSPKKRIIETTDSEKKLTFWSVLNGNRIAQAANSELTRYSPQEQYVVFTDAAGLVSQIYNAATGLADSTMAGRQFIGFSPDDRFLLTSSKAGEFDLWNMQTGKQIGKPIPAAFSIVFQANDFDPGQFYYFSPDGEILVTATPSPGKLEIRYTETGNLFEKPIDGDRVVVMNDGASRLITLSYQTNLSTVWDLATQKALGQPFSGRLMPLDSAGKTVIRLGDRGEMVIMTDYNGLILWDLNNGKRLGGPLEGNRVLFDKDQKVMAVSADYKVTLWDLVEMKRIGEPIFGSSFIGLSSDGGSVAMKTSVGGKSAIALWDSKTSRQLGTPVVGLSTAPFGTAILNPAGMIYATRNPNGSIHLSQQSANTLFEPQYVDTVVFGPNTDRLAIFNPNGTLTVWDTFSPSMPTKTIKDFEDPVPSVSVSPDGKVLASALKDGIALWSPVDAAKPDMHTNPHINEPLDIYLSPDGKRLVTNDKQPTPTISLWDVNTAKRIGKPINETFCGFSPDGRILITSPSAYTYSYNSSSQYSYYAYCYTYYYTNSYTFWDASTGKQIGEGLNGNYSFSPDYQYMTLQSPNAQDFRVLQISERNGSIELVPVGDPIPGMLLRFGPDNKTVLSNQNGITRVWNIDPDKRDKATAEIPSEVLTISPDGNAAVLREYQVDKSKYIFRFWNFKENRQIGQTVENITDYYPMFSPKSGFIAGATGQGELSVWNVATGKSFSITGSVSGFSPDDNYLVVRDGSEDTSSIWDTKTGKRLELAETVEGSYWGFYGPDGQFLVFRDTEAGNFVFYDLKSGGKAGTTSKADSISFSPNGEYFVTYLKGSISLWQTASLKRNTDFAVSGQIVGFSENSETLVTTSTNQGKTEISLWRTDNGEQRGDTFPYPGSLNGIRFAQAGKLLVLFGNEGLYVWNLLEPDETLPRIADPGGPINRIVFSPDSTKLATIGNDGVIVWSVTNRNQLTPLLTGNAGRIIDVAFDGDSIVILDADGTVFRSQVSDANSKPVKAGPPVPNACKIVLSPDGKRLAYISTKNELHLVSVGGSNPARLDNQDVFCYGSLAFSGNANTLAYTERDRIYISQIDENGQFGTPLEIAENSVSELTFILDGQILAGSSGDGRILIWDVNEQALLATFNQSGIVKRSANGIMQIYLPQERRLINLDLHPDVWRTSLKQWQQDLCEKAGRTLTEDEWQRFFEEEGEYPDQAQCPMPPPPPSE